ncbi:unnamed protein product, partial [Brassica oleracea]
FSKSQTHCHHPLCRSVSFSLQIIEVVRQQQRRSIPSTLFSLSLNRDASSLSCGEVMPPLCSGFRERLEQ